MNFISTIVFIVFRFVINITPFWLLYVKSDLIRFFLERVIKYRRQVIVDNIRSCFPEMTDTELKKTVHRFYKNLSDVMVEGLKAFTMNSRQIRERHKVLNPEVMNQYLSNNQTIIIAAAHYTNWEWGTLSAPVFCQAPIKVLYKPLSNHVVDKQVCNSRRKIGSEMVSIYNTARVFIENSIQTVGFVMASDQCPSNVDKAYWIKFFGRETGFLHGIEYYAKRYNYPVIFIDIQRVKRGYYELTCSVLTENPKDLEDGKITVLYAQKLEEVIRKKPENWLWSHRRWKAARPEYKPLLEYD